jgi:hypothetical protein
MTECDGSGSAVVGEAAQSVNVGCESIYGIREGEVPLRRNST